MSKKIIPALIALVVAIAWLACAFVNIPIFALAVSAMAVIGVYEIEKSLGVKNKLFMGLTLAFSAIMPIYANYKDMLAFKLPVAAILVVYIIAILIIMVVKHDNMEFKSTASGTLMSICLGYGFSCVIYLRDVYKLDENMFAGKQSYGMYFLLFAFFCSWMTDTMAFFAGSFFGKHKMCPKISPNKTIEGAIGGVLCNALLCMVMLAIFRHFFLLEVGYIFTFVIAVILSVVSIFGDLAASVIKRQNGIKDFGNLLPGHGGVMDRGDSMLFTLPTAYMVFLLTGMLA